MKKLALLLLLELIVISSALNAQEINYGLSISSGVDLISNSDKAVQISTSGLYPNEVIAANSLWLNSSVLFDLYLKNNFIISAGFNSFHTGYRSDSLSVSIVHGTMTQPDSIYTTTHWGYSNTRRISISPVIQFQHYIELKSDFYYHTSLSFSFPEIWNWYNRMNSSYDGTAQDAFTLLNGGRSRFEYNPNYYSLAISPRVIKRLNNFNVGTGPSFYMIREKYTTGKVFKYNSFQWNIELGFRF